MPRYYFDIFTDAAAAKDMATRTICEVTLDVLPRNGLELTLAINVRDEVGHHVMDVTLNFSVNL